MTRPTSSVSTRISSPVAGDATHTDDPRIEELRSQHPASGGPVRTLLFDLDGTLTDPREGITTCIQYALTRLGRVPPAADELEWCIGPPLLGSLEQILCDSPPEVAREALRLYRERFSLHGIFENSVYPGVPEMLGALQARDLQLFVATTKPTCFATTILDHFGLSRFFAGVYGSELDGTRSGKGELIAHLLHERSIEAVSAAMIGDRKHDVIGAQQNGLVPMGVSYGYGSIEELRQAGATCIFASPAEIQRFFDGENFSLSSRPRQ